MDEILHFNSILEHFPIEPIFALPDYVATEFWSFKVGFS
jgi:hypothetical protein